MPLTSRPFSGSWPDVGVLADGVVLSFLNRRADPPQLTRVIAGIITTVTPLPEGGLYQRLAVSLSGRTLCAWQGASTGLATIALDEAKPQSRGRTYGQNCVGVVWAGDEPRLVVQRTATSYEVVQAETGDVISRFSMAPTSQGFRDVLPDGTPILGDAALRRTMYGWLFSQPQTRGPWTVGQTDPAAIRLARQDRVYVTTAIPGDAYEPHLAVAGDKVWVCARTPAGVILATLTPPYPPHEPAVPPIVIPPPIEPPVEPPTEPIPPIPPVRPPVAFPSHAEFLDLTAKLDALYRDEMQRPADASHVDPLGRGRWPYDYAVHRQNGLSHAAAWAKVDAEIRRIAGLPPSP